MKYVIAIPCPDCMTKIFKSRESALDFVQKNLDKEDQEASMVIPIDEVVEFNQAK